MTSHLNKLVTCTRSIQQRIPFFLVLVFVLTLALMPLFFSFPPKTSFLRTANDSAHTGLFLVITFMVIMALQRLANKPTRLFAKITLYATSVGIGIIIGLLIEVIQHFIGRSASWEDITLDALGVMAAISLHASIILRNTWLRSVLLVSAIALVTTGFYKPAKWYYYAHMRNSTFPVLMDLETDYVHKFLRPSHRASLSVESAPQSWVNNNSKVLRIDFQANRVYPGVRLREVSHDWSGIYQALSIDVFSNNPDDVELHIAIRDQQHRRDGLQFAKPFTIKQGANHIVIPFVELRASLQTRAFKLNDMRSMSFYLVRPTKNISLYIDNVVLRSSAP